MHSWRHRWPVELMCRVLHVSERGYRCWRSRPISRRERTYMKVLAHIREQYSLSLGSYGRPRMTMELKEAGLDVGERRVGRLMRINGIKPAHAGTKLRQTVTIALVSRPTGSTVTLPPMHPTANGPATSPMSGHRRAGSTLPSSSTCIAAVSLAGRSATG